MIPRTEIYLEARMRIPEERAAKREQYRARDREMRRAKRLRTLRRWLAGEMIPTLVIGACVIFALAVIAVGLVTGTGNR